MSKVVDENMRMKREIKEMDGEICRLQRKVQVLNEKLDTASENANTDRKLK